MKRRDRYLQSLVEDEKGSRDSNNQNALINKFVQNLNQRLYSIFNLSLALVLVRIFLVNNDPLIILLIYFT